MSNFFVKDIRGVIPAMVTPFDENEALDLARTRALTAKLIEDGAQGLYLTGSTGEGFLCTSDERKAFVETVLDEAAGRIPVIVHVGAISTLASEDLARHAARAGAAAISSVPPIYWKFSDDQIAAYYSDLVQAAGIPMIVYNVTLAGLVSYEMLLRLGRIEGVEGIKYTSSTVFDIFRIKEALGQDFAADPAVPQAQRADGRRRRDCRTRNAEDRQQADFRPAGTRPHALPQSHADARRPCGRRHQPQAVLSADGGAA